MKSLQERFAIAFPPPQKRGLRAEIARVCGVKPPTVTAWFDMPEKVSTIDRTCAENLCQYYRLAISPAWLAEGKGVALASDANNSTWDANVTEAPTQTIQRLYPVVSEVQAGAWTALCDNFQLGDAADWQPSAKNLGKCGYLLRVNGKSMENPGGRYNFWDGMLLHVNPHKDPLPNQFVVVRRESTKEATFKRYVMIDGEPYLEAINPDWPKEQKYLKLQPGDAWCGVVVDASFGNLP